MANNRFEKCCHDFDLVRKTSQCDWINCFANHDPHFSVYFHKNNNSSCYCLNHRQLGQYWRCIINDRDYFCSPSCEQCQTCKEVSHIFSELQDAYFLILIHIFILSKIYLTNPLPGLFLVQLIKNH